MGDLICLPGSTATGTSPSSATTPITVRSATTEGEIATFFDAAAATFAGMVAPAIAASEWRRYHADAPDPDSRLFRAAYIDNVHAGGYICEDRWLRFGSARIRSSWIGAVVVDPAFRQRGVGTRLMRDAIDHARANGCGWLLLHGIANFYSPFGYVDVFDTTVHTVARADLISLATSAGTVRTATPADAPTMAGLRAHDLAHVAGAVERTSDDFAHWINFSATIDRDADAWSGGLPGEPMVSMSPSDRLNGYLVPVWGPLRSFGMELVAEDWPALSALLRYVSHATDGSDESATIAIPLPPSSHTACLLRDHLPVLSQSRSTPNAGWMAALADASTAVEALLPDWGLRAVAAGHRLPEPITLQIEEQAWTFTSSGVPVRLADRPTRDPRLTVRLSAHDFTQLAFGFRSPSWVIASARSTVPEDLVPLLDALVPEQPVWIAPTDGC